MSIERVYVVQYRRVGAKEWQDSHNETFTTQPGARLVKAEFIDTASDLVRYSRNDDIPRLRGDYEVRVVKREVIEKDTPVGGKKRFGNREIIEGVQEFLG